MILSGFDELENRLNRIVQEMPEKRDKFLMQEAEKTMERAKNNTPSDTGLLLRSWHRTAPSGGEVEIYNDAKRASGDKTEYYGLDVEWGHRQKVGQYVPKLGKRLKQPFVPGKHMLQTALDESADQFQEDAEQILASLFDA